MNTKQNQEIVATQCDQDNASEGLEVTVKVELPLTSEDDHADRRSDELAGAESWSGFRDSVGARF